MTLLQPSALWFLALLLPLVIVYLLKVKPQRKLTTTFFLWEKIFQENKSSAFFKKLKDFWSLLLLIVIFLFLIFSMSHPVSDNYDQKNYIFLLDTSASMSTIEEGGETRLSMAKKEISLILESMNMDQKAALLKVDFSAQYLSHMSSNHKELTEKLEVAKQSDLPFNKNSLLDFSKNEKWLEDYRVLLFSDACFEGSENLKDIELVKIGKKQDNIGIVAFDMNWISGDFKNLGIFVKLYSTYSSPVSVDLLLSYESAVNIQKVISVTVLPGINKPMIFDISEGKAGRWILKVDAKDAMKKDNDAFSFIPPVEPFRVSIKTKKADYFYRRCVEAFGQGYDGLVLDSKNPDIVLSEDMEISNYEKGKFILFNPSHNSPFWDEVGHVVNYELAKSKIPDHVVTKFCNIESFSFRGKKKIKPANGSLILVEDSDGIPLIFKTSIGESTAYVINMDPDESGFFLNVYFPVLIYSMVLDLMNQDQNQAFSFKTKDVIDSSALRNKVKFMGNPSLPSFIKPSKEGDRWLGPQIGFYKKMGESKKGTIGCSLLSIQESNVDNSNVADSSKPIPRGIPVSTWLIFSAIFLLFLESALYHRRKVG